MKGWLERINAALVRKIRRGMAPLDAEPGGLRRHDGMKFPYSELCGAVAFLQTSYVGDALSIVLDFGAGRVVTVSEADRAWRAVVEALDNDARTHVKSTEWMLMLVGSADRSFRVELL